MVRAIREIALSLSQIHDVNDLLTMYMGPNFMLVNISVAFENDTSAREVADTAAGLDRTIKQRFGRVKGVFIEAETGFLSS